MKILISGSSGFIGEALCRALEQEGHTLLRLTRGEPRTSHHIRWNPAEGTLDAATLAQLAPVDAPVDAVIHLAGESVAGFWTKAKKRAIRESRLAGLSTLTNAIALMPVKPQVFINASAVGYYGHRDDERLTELSPPGAAVERQPRVSPPAFLNPAWGANFLSRVCMENEAAAQRLLDSGVRVVNLRFGVVLARGGGALSRMASAFRFGVAGPLSLRGDQFMSWISLSDLIRVIQFTLQTPSIRGPVNAVSPQPTRNRDFTAAMSQAFFWLGPLAGLANRFALPAPIVRLTLGEFGNALLLSSAQALPVQLQEAGFTFEREDLKSALAG